MKTQTHTPGPWKVDEVDGGFLIGADLINGSHIAEAISVHDANLIASAPELLEHLKRLTNVVNNPKVSRADLLNISNDAMISISKAEGRI